MTTLLLLLGACTGSDDHTHDSDGADDTGSPVQASVHCSWSLLYDSRHEGIGEIEWLSTDVGLALGYDRLGEDYENTLLRTEDGGETWQDVADMTTITWAWSIARVSPEVAYMGWDGIWQSTDAGATWSFLHDSTPGYGLHFVDEDTAVATWATSLLRSTNGAQSFESAYTGTQGFLGLHVAPSGAMSTSTLYEVLVSADDGRTWTARDVPVADDGYAGHRVAFATPSRGLAAGTHGMLAVTEDGGVTWEDIRINDTSAFEQFQWLDADQVFMGGLAEEAPAWTEMVYKSDDGGRTWTAVADFGSSLVNVFHLAPDGRVYAGTNHGDIWRCE